MSVQFERKVLVNLRATESLSWGKPVLNSLFSLGSCPYVQFLATSRWTRYWESAFYALPAAPNGSFCYLGCRRRTYVWPIIALSEFNDFATRHFIVARSKDTPRTVPSFCRNGPFHRFLRPATRNLSPADTYPLYQERTSVRRPGRVFCGSKIWKGR